MTMQFRFLMKTYLVYAFSSFLMVLVYGNSTQPATDSTREFQLGKTNDIINTGNFSGAFNNTGNFTKVFNITGNFSETFDCEDENALVFESDEYEVLPNNSVILYGYIIPPEKYIISETELLVCNDNDYDNEENETSVEDTTLRRAQVYLTRTGSFISIVALIIHLVTFCYVPSLRNLPGYNLASLSVAFIFAYSFLLIGQIPEVSGVYCCVSGVFQYLFFFVAFFCMNVMAFDVWRTLRLTIQKLAVIDNDIRQFMWYSLYSWGCPISVTIALVILDNTEGVPEYIKPEFGKDSVCWMTNHRAQNIFFVIPVLILFISNGIFFVRSSLMISNNLMKCTNDNQGKTAKFNYVLYLRLGLMMGVTWLLGAVALISDDDIVWFIYDVLNSLQGLFLFLLFTCSKRVVKHLNESIILKKFSDAKRTSVSSNIA